MDRILNRDTRALTDAYLAGRLSRRSFVTRLLGLGLSASAIAALVTEAEPAAAASDNLKGNVRFLVGPWSDGEIDHQKHIAAGFNALHPDVTFEFRLYQWDTAAQEISTSAAEGAHDIYMTTESSYPDYEAGNGFEDLTARINDPSFAAEKAKYLYWDRTQNYGPKLLGLPISWHVEDALFVNMDKVAAAGHDETLRQQLGQLPRLRGKMTKPGETYGCGIGIQLGGYGEWYQRLRAAGGSYLTPDLKRPNVNLPEVVTVTQQMADLFKDGIAPPLGTYSYDAAPAAFVGRQACHPLLGSRDHDRLALADALQMEASALSAGAGLTGELQRHHLLHDQRQISRQGSDVGGGEVVDQRAERRLLGRQLRHLSGADRCGGVGLRQEQRAPARRSAAAVREICGRPGEFRRNGRPSSSSPRRRFRTATPARRPPRRRSPMSKRS